MVATLNTPVIQLDFKCDFRSEVLPGPSEHEPRPLRIPTAPEEVESLFVRFAPKVEGDESFAPWTGAFARGFASNDFLSGVFGWPDGKSVAVVAAGYGYAVNVATKTWRRLEPMPITDVRVAADLKLIVLSDFTNMFAYDGEKSRWKSERLSWDGITVTKQATNHLFGLAWDAIDNKEVEFVVDLRNGEHTGGAKPWAKR